MDQGKRAVEENKALTVAGKVTWALTTVISLFALWQSHSAQEIAKKALDRDAERVTFRHVVDKGGALVIKQVSGATVGLQRLTMTANFLIDGEHMPHQAKPAALNAPDFIEQEASAILYRVPKISEFLCRKALLPDCEKARLQTVKIEYRVLGEDRGETISGG